jgi:hypothetical protein
MLVSYDLSVGSALYSLFVSLSISIFENYNSYAAFDTLTLLF